LTAAASAAQLPLLEVLARLLVAAVPAAASAFALDYMCARKGLLPPGFRIRWRRALAFVLVAGMLWIGIFRPLGELGLELQLDLRSISTLQLFLLHILMLLTVLGWLLLGFYAPGAGAGRAVAAAPVSPPDAPPPSGAPGAEASTPPPAPPVAASPLMADLASAASSPPAAAPVSPPPPFPSRAASFLRQVAVQLGFRAPSVWLEIGLGLALGIAAWLVVLVALLALAAALWALGGEDALPKRPSAIVPWIAALPVLVRVAVSLSAGFVEEVFFRGFLQPRVGIALSTLMFVLAHLSYGQPMMLVGITLLSLIYALLVQWRQTVWPAVVAHFVFDGVQLLVMIPLALRFLGPTGGSGHASLLGLF
jgi:membrane protease YdiL (CAAX protease family)